MEKAKKDNIMLFRAAACVMVFVCHLCQKLHLPANLLQITQFGRFGVEIFFIISGYLIARSYYSYGKKNPIVFIERKAVRILPLYYSIILWFYLTDKYIFHYGVSDSTGYGWIRYLFILNGFLPYPNEAPYWWWNLGMSWTIPMFMGAYFLFPICLNVLDIFLNSEHKWFKGSYLAIGLVAITEIAYRIQQIYFPNILLILCYLRFFSLGILLFYAEREERKHTLIIGASLYELCLMIVGKNDYELLYSLIFLILIAVTENITLSGYIKNIVNVIAKFSFTIYMVQSIPLSQFVVYIEQNWTNGLSRYLAFIVIVGSTILLTPLFFYGVQRPVEKIFLGYQNKKKLIINAADVSNQDRGGLF